MAVFNFDRIINRITHTIENGTVKAAGSVINWIIDLTTPSFRMADTDDHYAQILHRKKTQYETQENFDNWKKGQQAASQQATAVKSEDYKGKLLETTDQSAGTSWDNITTFLSDSWDNLKYFISDSLNNGVSAAKWGSHSESSTQQTKVTQTELEKPITANPVEIAKYKEILKYAKSDNKTLSPKELEALNNIKTSFEKDGVNMKDADLNANWDALIKLQPTPAVATDKAAAAK